MSIPTRGIKKHLACRLSGLPPRMSASNEGEKNEALYGHSKKPFIHPQLDHNVSRTERTHHDLNRTNTEQIHDVPTPDNIHIDTIILNIVIQQDYCWVSAK